MDHFEKLELKKEITTEVRKDVTSAATTIVMNRLLFGFTAVLLEVFIWVTIIDMALTKTTFYKAYWVCLLLLSVRGLQVLMVKWCNEK
ncbi:MAG: hypothetical protein WC829_23690 [Hyphomicrobium sp.]|jgi:hypothetical protein